MAAIIYIKKAGVVHSTCKSYIIQAATGATTATRTTVTQKMNVNHRKRAMHVDSGGASGDGSYQPGPTLQVGSIHFNAMYDGGAIEANEEAWSTNCSQISPEHMLTFAKIEDESGGAAGLHGMVSNREVYDLLPSEPVFMCTGSSMRQQQLRHGCFVMSSLNHMYISNDDIKSVAERRGMAFNAVGPLKAHCITNEQKREVLQCKYQVRFVGFSVGSMTNEAYHKGQKPHVACNAGGLMSVKADQCIQSGQYVVVDYPLDNLAPPGKTRTNKSCTPPHWLSKAMAKDKEYKHLADKVTMVVRPLDPAADFASMSQPCVHAGVGHCGSKYPPWVVGQCVRGCSQPGETIDLRYSAEIRYPRYITLLSPPPFYMNRSLGKGDYGGDGTTLHDLYAASLRKMAMRAHGDDDDDGGGGGAGGGAGDVSAINVLPSIDCQDLVRHMIDRYHAHEEENWEENGEENGESEDKSMSVKLDPIYALMNFIDRVIDVAHGKRKDSDASKMKNDLNNALKCAIGHPETWVL